MPIDSWSNSNKDPQNKVIEGMKKRKEFIIIFDGRVLG
jgi:hypothetical protein